MGRSDEQAHVGVRENAVIKCFAWVYPINTSSLPEDTDWLNLQEMRIFCENRL